MTALSDFVEDKVSNACFRGTSWTAPTATWVALYTAAPSDTGGGTEVSGGSYVRVQVAQTSGGWTLVPGGASSNAADINFPTASGSWGTITHMAILDASSGGNFLFWGALTVSKVVASGDGFKFSLGNLSILVDN